MKAKKVPSKAQKIPTLTSLIGLRLAKNVTWKMAIINITVATPNQEKCTSKILMSLLADRLRANSLDEVC